MAEKNSKIKELINVLYNVKYFADFMIVSTQGKQTENSDYKKKLKNELKTKKEFNVNIQTIKPNNEHKL